MPPYTPIQGGRLCLTPLNPHYAPKGALSGGCSLHSPPSPPVQGLAPDTPLGLTAPDPLAEKRSGYVDIALKPHRIAFKRRTTINPSCPTLKTKKPRTGLVWRFSIFGVRRLKRLQALEALVNKPKLASVATGSRRGALPVSRISPAFPFEHKCVQSRLKSLPSAVRPLGKGVG